VQVKQRLCHSLPDALVRSAVQHQTPTTVFTAQTLTILKPYKYMLKDTEKSFCLIVSDSAIIVSIPRPVSVGILHKTTDSDWYQFLENCTE